MEGLVSVLVKPKPPEVPNGADVGDVEVEHLEKLLFGARTVPEPGEGKSFDVMALNPVAAVEVILKDQERGQGRGEIVDLLRLGRSPSGGA